MRNTKNLVITALCVAIGVMLPLAFHAIPGAGPIFLPMHISVLICGLICGWTWGLACGLLTPVLSCLLTQMPPVAMLPGMAAELAVYGAMCGLLIRFIQTKSPIANLYISLCAAMLAGRIVSGVLNALIFRAGNYSLAIWLTASFVTSLPGIAIQLVFIPSIVFALHKFGAIDRAVLTSA